MHRLSSSRAYNLLRVGYHTNDAMIWGFPGGSVVKKTRLPMQAMNLGFDPWVRKISWRRKWQPTPVFLPGKSHGRGAWQATVHGVTKESDMTYD